MAGLSYHRYGKSRVHLLKVDKHPGKHILHDYNVQVMLEGDFSETYLTGDNTKVIATDTIKNTVYILAHQHSFSSPEEFGFIIGKHFLSTYEWVNKVCANIIQNQWERMKLGGKDHEHSFSRTGPELRFSNVVSTRSSVSVESGIKDLLVLKTTASGFTGYHKDKYTTLQETTDRIFSTTVLCSWRYNPQVKKDADFNRHFEEAKLIIFERFGLEYSKSVQETLFKTGESIVNKIKEIDEVHLSMPNKHALLFNFAPFGFNNSNTVFQPIEEPSGLIEATIKRNHAHL